MALIITARNVSGLAPVSDYEIVVLINERVIWRGAVKGHRREDGWAKLAARIAEAGADAATSARPPKIRQTLPL